MKKIKHSILSIIGSIISALLIASIQSGISALVLVVSGFIVATASLVCGIIAINKEPANKTPGVVGIILSSLVLLYIIFGLYTISQIH